MDPSTAAPQTQPTPTQLGSAVKTQPPARSLADLANGGPAAQPKQQMISGHPEQAPIQTAAPETPQESEQPAKQETGAPAAPQTAEVQKVEIQPSMPEVKVEQSVEAVVEKSPDTEKPDLPEVVKQAGVTFSGPGIPVDENVFAVQTMPVTYEQAVVEEKATKIKDSKHWLMAKIIYIWKKLNPTIGKKGAVNQDVPSINS